jgi:hypothetical protein
METALYPAEQHASDCLSAALPDGHGCGAYPRLLDVRGALDVPTGRAGD